jgi:midasin (ATPase involved in ribosome maturation)
MVKFNSQLVRETAELRLWGQRGAPWELNLRDLCRWCEAVIADSSKYASPERSVTFNPGKFIDLIYVDRMRTKEDREKVSSGIILINTTTFLWSSGQSSWLQIRRSGFDSRHYQKKKQN